MIFLFRSLMKKLFVSPFGYALKHLFCDIDVRLIKGYNNSVRLGYMYL